MPHDTGAPVGQLQILHHGKKRLDFDLHGLRQKLPQNIGQWIIHIVGLTKGNNIASLIHGVSLSLRGSGRLDTRLDTPPISFRHHPLSRIALERSSAWWLHAPAARYGQFALHSSWGPRSDSDAGKGLVDVHRAVLLSIGMEADNVVEAVQIGHPAR